MIEVEKKFLINPSDVTRLLSGAEFVSQTKNVDIYWDTPDYSLTTKDLWLRSRNGKFELKVPMHGEGGRVFDQYEELDSDKQISDKLNLSQGVLQDELSRVNYRPFAELHTLRKKYKKGGFVIDVDELDFGYNIVEVEMLVNDKSEVDGAIKKILSFADDHNLKISQVRRKVAEYLKRNDAKHYKALVDAGVVQDY